MYSFSSIIKYCREVQEGTRGYRVAVQNILQRISCSNVIVAGDAGCHMLPSRRVFRRVEAGPIRMSRE